MKIYILTLLINLTQLAANPQNKLFFSKLIFFKFGFVYNRFFLNGVYSYFRVSYSCIAF
jgi:hypothetical protein